MIAAAVTGVGAAYPGVGTGPELGKLEIKAYQKIPKTKIAGAAHAPTPRWRASCARQVMDRIVAARQRGGLQRRQRHAHGRGLFRPAGRRQRRQRRHDRRPARVTPRRAPIRGPALPANLIGRRDGADAARRRAPTLRISLTLYAVDTGKVLWTATGIVRHRRPTSRSGRRGDDQLRCSTMPTRAASATPAARSKNEYRRKLICMPRLAPLDLAKLTPEQKKVADAIVAGPRGGLRGPVRALAAQPRAGRPRAEARRILPLQQLAAATISRSSRSAWSAATSRRSTSSTPMPAWPRRPASRPPSSRRCAPARRRPSRATSSASSTTSSPNISPPTASRRPTTSAPIDAFGEQGVVDLVGVCGYYMLVSMTLNVFEMPLPPGEPEPLASPVSPPSMTFLLFLAAACVIALSPGPGIFYVAARTLADGRGAGPGFEPGNGPGRPGPCRGRRGRRFGADHGERRGLRRAKIVGTLYLVWLGIKTAPKQASMSPRRRAAGSAGKAFRDGIVVEALNPKTAAFFLAFLPQFVDPAAGTGLAAVPRTRPHLGHAEHGGRRHRRHHRGPRPGSMASHAVAAAPPAHRRRRRLANARSMVVAARQGGCALSYSSKIATARVQPAEAPRILCGKQEMVKPSPGSASRLCSFSRWQ